MLKRQLCYALLLLLLFSAMQVTAQEAPPPYRLAPEDVITITVLQHPELTGDFMIPPDGSLTLPMAGKVLVTGKTIDELTEIITTRLHERLRDPEVVTMLQMARQQPVYIIGAVGAPGIYYLKPHWRITELLAAAHGLAMQPTGSGSGELSATAGVAGGMRLNQFASAGKFSQPAAPSVSLSMPTAGGGLPRIGAAGGVPHVGAAGGSPALPAPSSAVGGGVPPAASGFTHQPGGYSTGGGESPGAIGAAGGGAVRPGDCKLTLWRAKSGEKLTPDLADIFQFKPEANVLLQPGDFVIVELVEQYNVFVTGDAVKATGLQQLKPGLGVQELLAQAGGLLTPLADVRAVIKRNGKELPVDLQHGENPPMQQGDMLCVNSTRSVRLMVTGNVQRPGLVDLKDGEGPREAIALAGGLLLGIDPADTKIVLQQGAASQTILYTELATHAPIPLSTGDVMSVDNARNINVLVSGEVTRPGMYNLKPGEGLMEALAMAGGQLPDATLAEVKITRAATGATEVVDFSPTFRGGKQSVRITLSPGDQVVVPQFTRAVAVLGFVQMPGYYPLIEGRHLTVADAIGLAKGVDVNHRGALKKVALMRTETTGTPTRLVVDLEQYFKTGDTKYNPEVRAGDLVYVPQTTKPDWTFIFQTLTTTATLGIAAVDIGAYYRQ